MLDLVVSWIYMAESADPSFGIMSGTLSILRKQLNDTVLWSSEFRLATRMTQPLYVHETPVSVQPVGLVLPLHLSCSIIVNYENETQRIYKEGWFYCGIIHVFASRISC